MGGGGGGVTKLSKSLVFTGPSYHEIQLFSGIGSFNTLFVFSANPSWRCSTEIFKRNPDVVPFFGRGRYKSSSWGLRRSPEEQVPPLLPCGTPPRF